VTAPLPEPPRAVPLGLETKLTETEHFRRGAITAQAVLSGNNILAFDGPPGTGKTTCARWVAQHAERPCAIATMPGRPAPLDLLRYTHLKITGTQANGTRFVMQNDLLRVLSTWGGILIVDELQNTQAFALQELVYLYEESGHAFGLVLVGTGVVNAAAAHPQLLSRIMSSIYFAPLVGATLIAHIREIDPRFEQASTSVLAEHDQQACAGLLRRWVHTVRWLNCLDVTDTVTATDLKYVRAKLAQDLSNPLEPAVDRPGRPRRT
jgi:replication-associated recombination protein RarA